MSAPAKARPFLDATAVTPLRDGRYRADCDTQWSAPNGPNGGYLAALVLRALMAEVDEPARAPRSFTLHYLRPPAAGEVLVDVAVERSGRSVTTLTFRLEQDGRTCVTGIAAFATDQPTAVSYADAAPDVLPYASLDPVPVNDRLPPVANRIESRYCLGPYPFTGADEAYTGGWISLRDDAQPIDAPLLAFYVDAWLPAPFTRVTSPIAVPTLDLTIHFRAALPLADDEGTGRVRIDVRSTHAEAGFCEEDVRIWSPGGHLLAQSRQLALLRPVG